MVKSLAQNLLDPTPSETSLYWRLSRAEPTLYLSIDPDSGAGSDKKERSYHFERRSSFSVESAVRM